MRLIRRKSVLSMILAISLLFVAFCGPAAAYSDSKSTGLNGSPILDSLQEPGRLLQGNLHNEIRSDEDILAFFGTGRNALSRSSVPQADLRILKKDTDAQGKEHYLLQQNYQGLPVYGMYARAHVNKERMLYAITNDSDPELNLPELDMQPVIDGEQSVSFLQADIERELGHAVSLEGQVGSRELSKPDTELLIYPYDDTYYLAYRVELEYSAPEFGRWTGFVDAHSGAVLKKFSYLTHAAPDGSVSGSGQGYYGTNRTLNVFQDNEEYYLEDKTKPMYSLENGREEGVIVTYDLEFPFFPISSSSSVFNDPDAVDAHYFTGLVYDFYYDRYGWNSLDGKGMSIISLVNDGPIDNAFWNGYEVVYGDGAKTFECLSCAADVVAHELTHGVTEHTANLEYVGQSGALNESISDIMAAVFDDGDWTIGEDAGVFGGKGVLRDMQNPEKGLSPQPGHMDQYADLPQDAGHDNGGVHTNSGIPNHAAYLIASGIDSLPELQGQGRDLLGQIAFGALTSYLTPTSGFVAARDAFVLAAGDLNLTENQKLEVIAVVKEAWATVGLPYENGENDIVSFSVVGMTGKAEINRDAHTVTFKVEYGASLEGLIPNIAVSPGATLSAGGDIPHNFTDPVQFTVIASNQTSQIWTVQGAVDDPRTFNDIVDFQADVLTGPAVIDPIQHKVTLYVEAGDDVSSLLPSLVLSEEAAVYPASGSPVNLNQPVVYTVTAQNGTTQAWTVTAIKDSNSAKLLGAVAIENSIVALVFDRAMDVATAGNAGNYSMTSIIPGYYNPQVYSVQVDCNHPEVVYLMTYGLVSKNGYEIKVSQVKSAAGTPVRPDWTTGYFLTDDTAAPSLTSARVNNDKLSLTFNEYVQSPQSNATQAFQVNVEGVSVQIKGVKTAGRRIELTLQNAVPVNAKIAVTSTQAYKVTDLSGNYAVFQANVINRSDVLAPVAGNQTYHVNSVVKQMIKHPTKPILYSIFADNLQVVAANLATGEVLTETLSHQPERLYFADGKLYVALLNQEHDSYDFDEQQGMIAILESDSLDVLRLFAINTDPYDLAVDANGHIYVTSGSGQWTEFRSYSSTTGYEIDDISIRQLSYVQISKSLNRLYTINTDSIPRDMEAYGFNGTGLLDDSYDSPYHGDYSMSTLLRITPDERYLMNGAGTIFAAAALRSDDMKYVRSISPFTDIAFSADGQKFYTLNDKVLRQYKYSDFSLEKQFALPQSSNAVYAGDSPDSVLVAAYSANGTTVSSFSLATNVPTLAGLHSIAGNSTASLQSNSCPGNGGSTGGGSNGGGSTGGGGSNGGGGVPDTGGGGGVVVVGGGGLPPVGVPPTGEVVPEPPVTGPTASLSEKDLGINRRTDAQGGVVTTVTPDPDKLLQAMQNAQKGTEQSGGTGEPAAVPKVVIPIGDMGQSVSVAIPATLFDKANSQTPNGVIAVQSGNVGYEIPVKLLNTSFLSAVWGLNTVSGQLQIQISMEKADPATATQIRQALTSDGFSSVAEPIEFTISIVSGGTSKEVDDFGGTYVTRSFIVPGGAGSGGELTALIYDPVTKQTSFVPASTRTENGQTIVDVKTPHNSLYLIAQASKTFGDIATHSARKDIELMASKKVVLGVSATEFKPNQTVTRAEFAALLVRSLGLAVPASGSSKFTDIKPASWYAKPVVAASDAALITGYADGTFKPGGIITRQEMAVMIGRALRYAGNGAQQGYNLSTLKDSRSIAKWATADVQHALASGILEAQSSQFEPAWVVTRADAAVALKRMLQQLHFID